MTKINLSALSEPFASHEIEWRISRSGSGDRGIWARCLCYIDSRAIQNRLDAVCGPENWATTEPKASDLLVGNDGGRSTGHTAVACGLSLRINGEWITKYDVAEPTNIEPAKGGWSGALKRAGSMWGIGRYLYGLDEFYAEISEQKKQDWRYAKLKDGRAFYWLPPRLPSWALPKYPSGPVGEAMRKIDQAQTPEELHAVGEGFKGQDFVTTELKSYYRERLAVVKREAGEE